MKLRTSYFNGTVLKKDLTRFAPVWVLYGIFQLLFLVLMNGDSTARFASNADGIMQTMGVVNLAYGGLCALLLFGDLFKPKMCNTLHTMPLHREGWFLTHLCSGLLFCLLPNLVGCLVAAIMLRQYCFLAFVWLGLMVLQFLFFFGVGVFSMLCAGNGLGAAAIYGIVNFLAVIVAWMLMTFYEPLLFGMVFDFSKYAVCSPVVGFSEAQYVTVYYDNMTSAAVYEGFLAADWVYLFAAAAVGLIFLSLALLLYRKRKLEAAGDFLALPTVAPVFLVTFSLCAGATLYYLEPSWVLLFAGIAIGFFTGRMLIERKVNIFRGKTFLGFGILVAVFALSLGLTRLDPLGITRYIPEAEDIQSAQVSHIRNNAYGKSSVSTEADEIHAVRELHRQMLELRDSEITGETTTAYVQYTLKSGRTVTRWYYRLPVDSSLGEELRLRFSQFDYIFPGYTPESLTRATSHAEVSLFTDNGYYQISNKADILALLEAVEKDCQAGNTAASGIFHRSDAAKGNLLFMVNKKQLTSLTKADDRIIGLNITVYESCTNIQAFLDSYTPEPQNIYSYY